MQVDTKPARAAEVSWCLVSLRREHIYSPLLEPVGLSTAMT